MKSIQFKMAKNFQMLANILLFLCRSPAHKWIKKTWLRYFECQAFLSTFPPPSPIKGGFSFCSNFLVYVSLTFVEFSPMEKIFFNSWIYNTWIVRVVKSFFEFMTGNTGNWKGEILFLALCKFYFAWNDLSKPSSRTNRKWHWRAPGTKTCSVVRPDIPLTCPYGKYCRGGHRAGRCARGTADSRSRVPLLDLIARRVINR